MYATPFSSARGPTSRIGKRLVAASQALRSKKDWIHKLQRQDIRDKWAKEFVQQGLSEREFHYVVKEAEYYASLTEGKVKPSIIDGIWEADDLIEEPLRQELVSAVQELLENVPQAEKDYHPDSKDLVVDLVHPSLYCFVDDVSCKTDFDAIPPLKFLGCGQPERISREFERRKDQFPYQWLPAEFKIDKLNRVTIESYINNLHPEKHEKLYHLIGRIFEKFIPLFNKTLTDLLFPRPDRVDVTPYSGDAEYNYGNDDSPVEMELKSDSSDEDATRLKKKLAELDIMPRFVILEAEPFSPPNHIPYYIDLAGKTLQVIVKLANIELTPDKPAYEGGVWHVEGTPGENIVASGIYYYVSENISESRLRFRRGIEEPLYEQCDNVGVAYYYNLRDGDYLNEPLGSIITQQSKMLCFPNVFQHQVAPFQLVDKSKPGCRKILVFFLVDPDKPILSTRNVPPQQFHYFQEKLREVEPFKSLQLGDFLGITSFLAWPMRLQDAKTYRKMLMKDRSRYVDEEELFERPFSLCEH